MIWFTIDLISVLIYERILITISTLLYPSPSTQQNTLFSIVHGTHDSFGI